MTRQAGMQPTIDEAKASYDLVRETKHEPWQSYVCQFVKWLAIVLWSSIRHQVAAHG